MNNHKEIMNKVKKIFYLIIAFFIIHYYFLIIHSAYAVCPVCTVAVVGGIEVTRALGVDDLISSIWIGGLIVSMSFWLADWLTKKNILKPFWREIISLALFYLLTVPFLIWGKMIGVKGNVFLGIDKVVFGIAVGSIVFLLAVIFEKWLRKTNQGKVYFYYQKVIIPLLFLTIISFIFYKLL
ncbi:MAG: hypothetical protein ACPLRN_03285 [Microgenomates group bacterium]